MRLSKNIPFESFSESVRKIITTTLDNNYTSMLVGMKEIDIKKAIKTMQNYNICKKKISLCKSELRQRKEEKTKDFGLDHLSGQWRKWYSEEWNNVRRAAGKI